MASKKEATLAQKLAQTREVLCVGKGNFPAARSRVVIRLAQDMKAKPNANTRTLRPDKCLAVKSLDSSLRPVCPSQHGITAITTRELKATREGRFWGVNVVFRSRGWGKSDCAITRSPPPREAPIFF